MTPARQIHPIVNNFYAAQIASPSSPFNPPDYPSVVTPPPLQNQIQISQTSNRRMQNSECSRADDDVDATSLRGSEGDWRRTLI